MVGREYIGGKPRYLHMVFPIIAMWMTLNYFSSDTQVATHICVPGRDLSLDIGKSPQAQQDGSALPLGEGEPTPRPLHHG